MAKKENVKTLAGGLTAGLEFGDSKKAGNEPLVRETAPVAEEPAVTVPVEQPKPAEQPTAATTTTNNMTMIESYAGKLKAASETEARTSRIQVVVTPTTANRLNVLVNQGKIKSRNDLINFLVESYLDSVNWED